MVPFISSSKIGNSSVLPFSSHITKIIKDINHLSQVLISKIFQSKIHTGFVTAEFPDPDPSMVPSM